MGLTVLSELVAPPPVGRPQTYAVHTRSEIRVPGHQLVQASTALVRLTTLETAPAGSLLEVVCARKPHRPR